MKYVVMSCNQLMIIDGQPTRQVVLNQPQIAYQENSAAGIITIPQHQPQTYLYMENSGSIAGDLAPVDSVGVQPIVLNHRLGSQISLVPRPGKASSFLTQQINLMQQNQVSHGLSKIVRPQMNLVSTHLPINSNQDQQTQHFATSIANLPHKQQENFINQPSVSIEKAKQHLKQIHLLKTDTEVLSRMNTVQHGKEANQQEVIKLSDGKVISVEEYKDIYFKPQQPRFNVMPGTIKKTKANPNRPRAKAGNSSTSYRNRRKCNPKQETTNLDKIENPSTSPQHMSSPSFNENNQVQYRRSAPFQIMETPNRLQYPQNNQQQLVQHSAPQPLSSPQAVQQNIYQQPQRNKGHNYLIQPTRYHSNKTIQNITLPNCVPTHQLQEIIETTPILENSENTVRMLILLANGEQRLITFSLPNQACAISEILDQVGILLTPDTEVDVAQVQMHGINYVVTVGFKMTVLIKSENSEQNTNYQVVTEPQPIVKEPSPEPVKEIEIELPKFIEGKMAVCGYCGYLSDDFNKCMRCKTKFPENVKAVTAHSKKGESKPPPMKKIDPSSLVHTNGAKEIEKIAPKKKTTTKSKANDNEPVILTLSSDDEDDDKSSNINESLLQKLGSSVTLSPIIRKEPSLSDIQKSVSNAECNERDIALENCKSVLLQCRTVRIGSYRTIPKENIIIDSTSVTIKVTHTTNPKNLVILRIERNDIVKVLISFQKQLPVLFYYLRPHMGKTVRDLLGMRDNDANYYDPLSDKEPHRRLTILPENIPDDVKSALIDIYRPSMNFNILDELTLKEANDILIKTCPKELTLANLQPTSGSAFEVMHLLAYPPEGRGRISINTEDYMCLASDQFLNDVIIDFYLKYLVNGLAPEEQEKIHVFSTFFYKRLTTKPAKASRKIQPAEVDPSLSAAEKRHARVKTWTKNIDIFKKDFVVIPINENSHWFLAIICYPGLDGCQTFDGHPVKIEIKPKKKVQTKTTIGSVTITPVKKEELPCEDVESDKDEAEGDESELESDDSIEEAQKVTSHSNRPPIKQPCILIFDSLAGTSRSRVVATLRDYLTCEYKAKNNTEKIFTKDVIKGACPKVPQQTNFTDCGLYLLQYVEHFLMEPIKDYYIPINSLKLWFDEMTVTRKREDISILIKKLMMDYNKDINLLPEILLPTKNGNVVDQFAEEEEMEEENFENEEFESPPVGSETEIDTSMPMLEEGEILPKCESDVGQHSSESACVNKLSDPVSNVEQLLYDSCELTIPKLQSNKDTLSYLKAKRIIRNKPMEGPSTKKSRFSQ